MRKESIVIALSGGCFSGKTTTAAQIKDLLKRDGYSVRVAAKVRHFKQIGDIDMIRRHPSDYLEMQDYVLRNMQLLEMDAFESRNTQVILFDRAMTDAIFYPLFYLDKSKLTHAEIKTLHNLLKDAESHIKFAFEHIYDRVIFFKPLTQSWRGDMYRPAELDILKYTESMVINMLNKAYAKPAQYISFDPNNDNVNSLMPIIYEILKSKKR